MLVQKRIKGVLERERLVSGCCAGLFTSYEPERWALFLGVDDLKG